MISYDQLFMEMERQLKGAQKTTDEQEMRQALAAIRSLCEVALGGEASRPVRKEKVMPKMLETPQVQSLSSLEIQPMQEEDGANGKSLFDF